jgi:sugar fermentation stimulation protein A
MTGVCQVGAPVLLSQSDNPNRKLPYTWEAIYVDRAWVGVNTARPNRIVEFGLQQGWFPELQGFTNLQREVAYGRQRSKIDFFLSYPEARVYLEVKNTTWCRGNLALFPDTVTARGQKHLQELTELALVGQRAATLYFIHRDDCDEFAPGEDKDPQYAKLLQTAIAAGVEILPYRFRVTPAGVECIGRAALAV